MTCHCGLALLWTHPRQRQIHAGSSLTDRLIYSEYLRNDILADAHIICDTLVFPNTHFCNGNHSLYTAVCRQSAIDRRVMDGSYIGDYKLSLRWKLRGIEELGLVCGCCGHGT